MFGSKISFIECRDILQNYLIQRHPKIITDETNCFTLRIQVDSRDVDISIKSLKRNKVTLDVDDSFGIIRIPRTDFKNIVEFKEFLVNCFGKI